MPVPKWFYIVIAAYAVMLTLAELGSRLTSWKEGRWEVQNRLPQGVFNSTTGVYCNGTGISDSTSRENKTFRWVCIDMKKGAEP